jgi:cysteine-rich repeat protein
MQLARQGLAAGMLLGLAVSLAPSPATAQSRNVLDYVLLARDSISVSQVEVAAGDIGVLDGPFASPRGLTAPSTTLAAPIVRLGDGAVCRGIRAVSMRGGGPACQNVQTFAPPFATATAACEFPDPFPECDRFAPRVVVRRGSTLALAPGVYGDVLVEGGGGGSGTLLLDGTYALCNARVSRNATVQFAGPTTLYIDGSLTSGNGTTFEPRPPVRADQVRVFVAGRLVRFNRKASVGALVCAPQATVRITNGVSLRGRVVGASMRVRRSSLTLATDGPPTTTTTHPSASSTTTTLPSRGRCGDGVVDPDEVCDGDIVCTSAGGSFLDCIDCTTFTSGPCTPPPGRCGDGVRDPGEACDDGNTADCDGCSARCAVERVGNGVVDCGEQCDDGNTLACDGCDGTGALECGNGVIDAACGEVCDGLEVAGQTCPGGIVTCTADCRRLDRTLCPEPVQAPVEVCGNCLDDDLDGLVDFEDPDCCRGPALDGARLKKLRLKPRRRGGTALRLRAGLGPNASRVEPLRHELVLQARTADGPLLCAHVPAGSLRAKRRVFRFRDPEHRVAAAQSLDTVRLRATKRGQLRLRAVGKRTPLTMPTPGPLQVTVAAVDPTSGEARCAVMTAPLRHGRGRVLRAP